MLFPICKDDLASSRQSPINIKSADAKYNNVLKPLKMTAYDLDDNNKMQLSNNGHSIVVSMGTNSFQPKVIHNRKNCVGPWLRDAALPSYRVSVKKAPLSIEFLVEITLKIQLKEVLFFVYVLYRGKVMNFLASRLVFFF